MKIKIIGSFLALFSFGFANAQVAVNFTCDDCNGVTHDLFTELDTGNVIVLLWVMPCISCIVPAQTTHSTVLGFQSEHPNKVFMYLCDDFADTDCTSLGDWATTNGVTNTTNFSDASIKMTDYGFNEMNKVVVIGGLDHTVYYRADNVVNADELAVAIQTAIDESPTSVFIVNGATPFSAMLYPNPAGPMAHLIIDSDRDTEMEITVSNELGQKISQIFDGPVLTGETIFKINTTAWGPGIYLVNIEDHSHFEHIKLIVSE